MSDDIWNEAIAQVGPIDYWSDRDKRIYRLGQIAGMRRAAEIAGQYIHADKAGIEINENADALEKGND